MKTIEIVVGILLLFVIVAALAATGTDTKKEKAEWVLIHHESDVEYFVRTSAIIGFVERMPGDPKGRNGILLSNGFQISTSLELEQFQEIAPGRMIEVKTP